MTPISYSRIDTNNVIGDLPYSAWSKVNSNFYYLENLIEANSGSAVSSSYAVTASYAMNGGDGGGTGGGSSGTNNFTNSITISGSVNIADITHWQLVQVCITGSDFTSSVSGTLCTSSNGCYYLDHATNFLTNSCGFIISPLNLDTSSIFDPATNTYLSSSGLGDNPNSMSVWFAVDNLVKGLKSASLWDLCYALYPFAGNTAYINAYSLKNDNSYHITWNGPYISSNAAHGNWGVHNNNSIYNKPPWNGNYGDTNFNPANIGSSTDISLAEWLQEPYVITYPMGNDNLQVSVGGYTSGPPAGNLAGGLANSPSVAFYTASNAVQGAGTIIVSRSGSATQQYSKTYNYSPITTTADVTQASENVYIASVNIGGLALNANATVGLGWIGRGLNTSQMSTLHDIIENYNGWRPTSSFAYQYGYGIPGQSMQTFEVTMSINNKRIMVLWAPLACGNAWWGIGWAPGCPDNGFCLPPDQTLILCSGSMQWYVVPKYLVTSGSDGQGACAFCNTH